MPTSTVNWLWIGNIPIIDSTATTNVTQTQLTEAGMVGYTATGRAQIAPVAVTGTTTTSSGVAVFTAPFNAVGGFVSQFSFDSPSTTGVVTNLTVQTTFRADVLLTLPDGTTTTQVATIVQMSNGDMFLRPNANFVSAWNGIDALQSVQILTATPFPDNTVLNATISFNPSIFDIQIPCFTGDTLIETEHGLVRALDLTVGTMVRTADHGMQRIRWIGRQTLSLAALSQNETLRPILIAPGALGAGLPRRPLMVSPQHRMLIRSRIAERMFETTEVLVSAVHLVGLPGISIAPAQDVTYVHLMFDHHEVIFAEGAPSESLYPGPMALRSIGVRASEEIFALFPDLMQLDSFRLRPARPFVKGRQGRTMAERHLKNAVELLAA